MLRFINDFQITLDGQLTAVGTVLPISGTNAAKLDLTGDGEYLLTLSDSLIFAERTAMEIVRVSSGLALERGQEGTTAQLWESGTFVICAVTAGGLAEIAPPTIVSDTVPMSAPQAAGQQWIYEDQGAKRRYVAMGSSSIFDWRWMERDPVLGPTAQIAVTVASPSAIDLQAHEGAQVSTALGLASATQQLNFPAMPAGAETRFDLFLQPFDALTVDIDCSDVEGTAVEGPFVSTETMPAGVTVSVVSGRVRIACTNYADLRVEIIAGSDALGFDSAVVITAPFPEYIAIN